MRTMTVIAVCLVLGACSKKKSGVDAVAKIEAFAKAMCECKDKACAEKVNADVTAWGIESGQSAGKNIKPDPDFTKKSADAMDRYGKCMTKAMAAGPGSGSAQTAQGSGSDAGSGSGAGAGSGSGGGGETMTKGGGNCPSMVLHAETKAEVKGKDVVLTITSTDKDAVLAIQKRAEELIKEKQDAPGGTVHDQKGSQGGKLGLCPVYWEEGGKGTQKKDPKGAIVTITPKDKPEALKTIIDDRIKKAADWVKEHIKEGDEKNKGGVGGGKGDHGSKHAGSGDGKGKDRKGGDGKGGGGGTGGGGGAGTGGGSGGGKGSGDKKPADKGGGGW